MNNSTFFKSFNQLFTLLAMASIIFLASCGGDDEPPTPNCDGLELTATAEGNTISVSATGGAAPYVYSLNGEEQSGTSFTELEPGTYAVLVTDANECTDSENVEIEDPCEGFAIEASGAGYAVAIEVEEGEGPFNFVISYGETEIDSTSTERSITVNVEEAAATTITVTDANGCEEQTSLTAEEVRSFTDSRDGQTYKTIKIGNQIWFAENFNYNTNTADSTSSWYYDDDSTAYAAEYGRLYTWYVATEIAPEGWELANAEQWEELINFLGPDTAGDQLRVGGGSGFNLKSGGLRNRDSYLAMGTGAVLWTSTSNPSNIDSAIAYDFEDSRSDAPFSFDPKVYGLYVRFIKKM